MYEYKRSKDAIESILESPTQIVERSSIPSDSGFTYENGIIYTDVHGGNFLIWQNKLKLIDFDPKRVFFEDSKDILLRAMLSNYETLVFMLYKRFNIRELYPYTARNFNGMRRHVKKLEKKRS